MVAGWQIISGGVASGATILSGGFVGVQSGGTASNTLVIGNFGVAVVKSGGVVISTLLSGTGGGGVAISSGGLALYTTAIGNNGVSPAAFILSGGSASGTIDIP